MKRKNTPCSFSVFQFIDHCHLLIPRDGKYERTVKNIDEKRKTAVLTHKGIGTAAVLQNFSRLRDIMPKQAPRKKDVPVR
ncbi:hypothetical protein SYK_18280 [Pseudodesulfovibrio nedwellii]|uniref:Transposase IS200-like domain-containing protein n=1 Tax=Pseudodesulfovibrio nedwellii TaxID=2973072 RepID=A0ABM8B1M2_9BACT|nr:hypothetical protein SYK_18280 [Pseudodesulfovibrio nedwellii]